MKLISSFRCPSFVSLNSHQGMVNQAEDPKMFQLKQSKSVFAAFFVVFAFVFAAGSVAADAQHDIGATRFEIPQTFAGVADPAAALFERLKGEQKTLESAGNTRALDEWLDQVRTLHHRVPVQGGYEVAMIETFTLRSWLRRPHRAVVLLAGSAFRANHFSIEANGYNGAAMIAQRSGFAFAVDYIGVGDSTRPADGHIATYELQRESVRQLINYIRVFRAVPKVDLVGEGYGASIAFELAADGARVRSATGSSMIYREVGAASPLADPGFVGILEASPDGYFFLPGEGSLIFMQGAPQEALDFVAATQGGTYPIDNFLVALERPFFDPTRARAPGLVIHGSRDPIGLSSDIENLAAEYGRSGATLAVNPDAGHAPRIERPEIAGWYWSTLFDFIDLQ